MLYFPFREPTPNWTLMPSVYNNYFNTVDNHCYITWYTAGNYALSVNAVNACGASSNYWYPIYVGGGSRLSVSPNPASENVQISINATSNNSIMSSDSIMITTSEINSLSAITKYTISI